MAQVRTARRRSAYVRSCPFASLERRDIRVSRVETAAPHPAAHEYVLWDVGPASAPSQTAHWRPPGPACAHLQISCSTPWTHHGFPFSRRTTYAANPPLLKWCNNLRVSRRHRAASQRQQRRPPFTVPLSYLGAKIRYHRLVPRPGLRDSWNEGDDQATAPRGASFGFSSSAAAAPW